MGQRFLSLCQSGRISPNLVTLASSEFFLFPLQLLLELAIKLNTDWNDRRVDRVKDLFVNCGQCYKADGDSWYFRLVSYAKPVYAMKPDL